MRGWKRRAVAAAAMLLATASAAPPRRGFDVVVLGARGGIEDGNLSAFLIRPVGDVRGVTCDAGTLVNGLRVADAKGALRDLAVPRHAGMSRAGWVLTHDIKGYLISHAHLDHVAGLIVASPDDATKPVYALPSVQAELGRSYFHSGAWSNFTDRGEAPQLGKYHLVDLAPEKAVPLDGTAMTVTGFPLSHGGLESTAFLVERDGAALLCFGDTGADAVERSDKLARVWRAVAPRVRSGVLKGMVIEVSYPSERPDDRLFGHLTPKWLLAELHALAREVGPGGLKGFTVLVAHVKYSLTDTQPQRRILSELNAGNDLGVRFVIAGQGMRLKL